MLNIARTFANDGWLYVGMQNTDIGLASLVNCPVCPVTDGRERKMRPGPAKAGGVWLGRATFIGLSGWVSVGRARF